MSTLRTQLEVTSQVKFLCAEVLLEHNLEVTSKGYVFSKSASWRKAVKTVYSKSTGFR